MKKVTDDIEAMKFNTAIAALMGLINEIFAVGHLTRDELLTFIKLLCPIAPHLCEEINEKLGGKTLLSLSAWPEYDEAKTVDETVEVAVQFNGKLKGTVMLPKDCPREEAVAAVRADPRFASMLEGKTVIKEIAVPNRIVNFVVR